MSRLRFVFTLLAAFVLSACAAASATSRGYQINTADVTCDDANRYVQQSLTDMGMRVTDFRKARPGSPGMPRLRAAPTRAGR
jgi:hypothetical protein